jgi:N-terminal acetyltransferase B complex non-catalytic subunit
VEKFLKDGTIIKDVEGIELLEWACEGRLDFVESLGPLRLRLVKAQPKDKVSGTRCLESCLLHWDLVSAQQVCVYEYPGHVLR